MTRNEQRLLRHLIIAVLIKLVVLMALWWTFVRDARVSVDTERVAEKISGAVSSQGVSK
ncbi:MAG: cytochrome oxidase putative small subunit CydP [Burkholderiaceae bacterium]